jgi:hypothetical protein
MCGVRSMRSVKSIGLAVDSYGVGSNSSNSAAYAMCEYQPEMGLKSKLTPAGYVTGVGIHFASSDGGKAILIEYRVDRGKVE